MRWVFEGLIGRRWDDGSIQEEKRRSSKRVDSSKVRPCVASFSVGFTTAWAASCGLNPPGRAATRELGGREAEPENGPNSWVDREQLPNGQATGGGRVPAGTNRWAFLAPGRQPGGPLKQVPDSKAFWMRPCLLNFHRSCSPEGREGKEPLAVRKCS